MKKMATTCVLLLGALLCSSQSQLTLAQKVEDAIRAAEPDWKCIYAHAVLNAPLTVPSEKRLLIVRWEHRSKNSQLDFVDLWIFQVDSRTEAEMFLAPVREGKVASGWKVNQYNIGDEAFLSRYSNGRWYDIVFRKGMVVVKVKSDSSELAERFAKYADKNIGPN